VATACLEVEEMRVLQDLRNISIVESLLEFRLWFKSHQPPQPFFNHLQPI
jgi:hypothetical protein